MKDKFYYTYSAPAAKERKRIEGIRNDYLPQAEGKAERLRRLDKKVKTPPKAAAYCIGSCGVLLFGEGMSLAMVWAEMLGGALAGAAGIALAACAYPVYRAVLKRRKAGYGAEILRLCDELLSEGK